MASCLLLSDGTDAAAAAAAAVLVLSWSNSFSRLLLLCLPSAARLGAAVAVALAPAAGSPLLLPPAAAAAAAAAATVESVGPRPLPLSTTDCGARGPSAPACSQSLCGRGHSCKGCGIHPTKSAGATRAHDPDADNAGPSRLLTWAPLLPPSDTATPTMIPTTSRSAPPRAHNRDRRPLPPGPKPPVGPPEPPPPVVVAKSGDP